MKGLIFSIFSSVAQLAMDKDYEIKLVYDTGSRKSKTIVSQSDVDTNSLEMNVWRSEKANDYEDGYDQGCMDMLDEEIGEEE